MNVRRLLIGLPLVLIALLLQSALWVPTQKRQAKVNPERLEEFYQGSIGDAEILNPILSADTSSSEINGRVFEGLLDYDENLQHRGRLATSWVISEEAYLEIRDGQSADAIKQQIEQARAQAKATSPLRKITAISPAEALPGANKHFVKFTLSEVDQDFFKSLEGPLGHAYVQAARTEHNPVILFTLRDGVHFHDGHPFTAEDVKFTYEAIMDARNLSPRTSDYEPIKSVTVVDPLHLRVVYKRLYSPAVGTWGMGILPKHLLDQEALAKEAQRLGKKPETFSVRDSAFNRHPIGTGAFKFADWKTDRSITLTRNDDYWEGPPNYRKVVVRVIPDLLSQEMELYSGTLDGYSAQPHQVERLKSNPDYQNFSGLSFSYSYIAYNLRRPIFADVRVRRALGMALNIDPMIRYLYYGHAERTTGPFLKQTPYYDKTIQPLPYDPEGALALLKEAGWERNAQGKLVNKTTGAPFQFTLLTNNGNDLRKGIMTIAQQSWEKLGIEVTTQSVEWTVFLQKHVNELNFDAIILGWSMGIDPDLYQIWHSSQTGKKQLNFGGYNNPKADELIVRIRQEYNPDKLIDDCHALHRLIYEDQPYTFLVTEQWTALLDKGIVRRFNESGSPVYKKITPTATGSYDYYFNQWIKVANP